MFSKNREKLESLIGGNTHVKGDVSTKGTLRVDGKVDGNVEADWVILSGQAHVKGDVEATGIIVGGTIDGNLRAREVIEVKNKGRVKGDIVTGKLTVSEGGYVEGKISMNQESAKLVDFAPGRTQEA
ncbi:MAG: polymer-forming cytoskeletal protein [Thermodesulfovibrionales bacterium]